MLTCPHCHKEFDPQKTGDSKHLSWKNLQWAGLVVIIAMILFQFNQPQTGSQLLSSITTLHTNMEQAYEVFDKVSTSIQGRVAKLVRVRVQNNDKDFIIKQAKELITAERNNKPTNIIYLYFYVTDKDPATLPLESWIAKVTFVNFALVKDLSPGDFGNMQNIAPGTYIEIRN